jgi:hypothetical protein
MIACRSLEILAELSLLQIRTDRLRGDPDPNEAALADAPTPSRTQPNYSDGLSLTRPSVFALLGISIYFAGLVLPLPSCLPLIGLPLMSALAAFSRSPQHTPFWSALTLAVTAFLASVSLSTLVSEDIGRRLRPIAPMASKQNVSR